MSYEWMGQALCAQTDPDMWFPEVGGSQTVAAKRICASCPVRAQCVEHAQRLEGGVSADHRYGAWGGQTPRERELIGGEQPAAIRDRDAVRLVGQGLSVGEVAARLGCSDRTVARALHAARRTENAA
ncbi:transcription factor WhiB [Streptomyces sp. 130]|uniref:WhiB family transcriptional regulator n=1 Tax=Streptomyces sp. 130 TaxID=2591006 RepID=UPI00118175FF|nr:WhiB family transcriptional regulator [Streptomyces sp. 130]TRV72571.1 transcription factor WhiB [Streptomyces sp. 130]